MFLKMTLYWWADVDVDDFETVFFRGWLVITIIKINKFLSSLAS